MRQLGVFGFLSGSDAIKESGGFNAAITGETVYAGELLLLKAFRVSPDARFALEFVQSNIGKFGGSKTDVTIWGQSVSTMSI